MREIFFHQVQECLHRFVILTFSLFYLPILLHAVCALFVLVTVDVVYLNSVSFKHIDSSCHFLKLN